MPQLSAKPFLKPLIVFVFILSNCSYGQDELNGKVVSIADGDSFTILVSGDKQVKIRLHGIDSPERTQDYGDVAKKYLMRILSDNNDSVRVVIKDTDRYGRLVCIAYAGNVNVNEEMLKNGLAWHYKYYDNNSNWSKLEVDAKAARLNLWSLPNPTPPWEFRKKIRQKN